MRRICALAAVLALLLTACGASAEPSVTRQIFAMDTTMTFTVYGDGATDAVQAAVEEVQRLEKLLSRTDADSEVSRLNGAAGQTVTVSEETCRLVEQAVAFSAATGGAFDITVAPVVAAWGFTTDAYQVPAAETLAELLPLVDSSRVQTTSDTVTLGAGQSIDLGGIAKGYASDCMAYLFAQQGVERGWVSLGGNVLAWGGRPDGTPWQIGIQDPAAPTEEQIVGTVGLESGYAVTSGGYQRYFEEDGVTYHHIIDPATGCPADSDLVSVTVIAPADGSAQMGNGTLCDALSTALFVMGEEQALAFWRSGGYDFDLVLVTRDGRVVVTAGIAEVFTPTEGSGYSYETVS